MEFPDFLSELTSISTLKYTHDNDRTLPGFERGPMRQSIVTQGGKNKSDICSCTGRFSGLPARRKQVWYHIQRCRPQISISILPADGQATAMASCSVPSQAWICGPLPGPIQFKESIFSLLRVDCVSAATRLLVKFSCTGILELS